MHVLAACKMALSLGRYTWRHNEVLSKICLAVEAALVINEKEFIHAADSTTSGGTPATQPVRSILQTANDWKLAADLDGSRNYPACMKQSGLRPDMVVYSESSRTMIVIELTVPFESNISSSHEYKLAKYEGLLKEIHKYGYRTHMFAVEVGARGLATTSLYDLLKRLGLSNRTRARFLKQSAETAERASYWVWLKRNDKEWKPEESPWKNSLHEKRAMSNLNSASSTKITIRRNSSVG